MNEPRRTTYLIVVEKFRAAKSQQELNRIAKEHEADLAALKVSEKYSDICSHAALREAYKYYTKRLPFSSPVGKKE